MCNKELISHARDTSTYGNEWIFYHSQWFSSFNCSVNSSLSTVLSLSGSLRKVEWWRVVVLGSSPLIDWISSCGPLCIPAPATNPPSVSRFTSDAAALVVAAAIAAAAGDCRRGVRELLMPLIERSLLKSSIGPASSARLKPIVRTCDCRGRWRIDPEPFQCPLEETWGILSFGRVLVNVRPAERVSHEQLELLLPAVQNVGVCAREEALAVSERRTVLELQLSETRRPSVSRAIHRHEASIRDAVRLRHADSDFTRVQEANRAHGVRDVLPVVATCAKRAAAVWAAGARDGSAGGSRARDGSVHLQCGRRCGTRVAVVAVLVLPAAPPSNPIALAHSCERKMQGM